MNWNNVRELLGVQPHSEIVDALIINRRPWIFESDEDYADWQGFLQEVLGNANVKLMIVGSAATGFSLSPLKPGRPFRAIGLRGGSSDIDIAVLDSTLFEHSWNALIDHDRAKGFGGSEDAHRLRVGVYNGFVAANRIPRATTASQALAQIRTTLNRKPPLRGYPLSFRIYRRLVDLRAYQTRSLNQLHAEVAKL